MKNVSLFSCLLFATVTAPTLSAQTEVGSGSFGFSDGVHPTFSVIIEGADVKYVEGFWRDELKRISKDVASKKELIGTGALVPQVSPDTVRVLVKADQRKGNPMVTVHVAILSRKGWVGPDSEPRELAGAERFVQEHGTALRRQIAQEALAKGERVLADLQRELAGLQREKERAEGSVEKSKEKAAEAVQEQERTQKELDDITGKVDAQRRENTTTPNEENGKLLSDLLKQQDRLHEKHRRALDQERAMNKKIDDLTWDIRKNVEVQERKAVEVSQQEAVVAQLREKLGSIR